MKNRKQNTFRKIQTQNPKNREAKLFGEALFDSPKSRLCASTMLGYLDFIYMMTQEISDWIEMGSAQVIIKYARSGPMVEIISLNPEFFKEANQLKLY